MFKTGNTLVLGKDAQLTFHTLQTEISTPQCWVSLTVCDDADTRTL